MGYPDLRLLSMIEVTDRLALIVEHAGVPVIADADTGYGNALNMGRTVRDFERAGVAALHLEDQVFPKRCGHYEDKALISTEPSHIRSFRLPDGPVPCKGLPLVLEPHQ
jgi:2-methylisocitrate lyase-like PEP mutase family enzyme